MTLAGKTRIALYGLTVWELLRSLNSNGCGVTCHVAYIKSLRQEIPYNSIDWPFLVHVRGRCLLLCFSIGYALCAFTHALKVPLYLQSDISTELWPDLFWETIPSAQACDVTWTCSAAVTAFKFCKVSVKREKLCL